jgi:hypothetical protein
MVTFWEPPSASALNEVGLRLMAVGTAGVGVSEPESGLTQQHATEIRANVNNWVRYLMVSVI